MDLRPHYVLRRDDKNGDQISGWKREKERERVNVSPGRKGETKRGEYIGEMKRISMHAMLYARRPLTYTHMSTAADDCLSLGRKAVRFNKC